MWIPLAAPQILIDIRPLSTRFEACCGLPQPQRSSFGFQMLKILVSELVDEIGDPLITRYLPGLLGHATELRLWGNVKNPV